MTDIRRPSGLILPAHSAPARAERIWPWLLIYTGPDLRNGGPKPQFFPSHGRNLETFEAKQKKGEVLVLGHVFCPGTQADIKRKAQEECRKLNDRIPGRREELAAYRATYKPN